MDKLEISLKKQRFGFQPGRSGNPKGKPKGRRCRVTELLEKIMADNSEAIVKAVVEAAKAGDGVAMKLCVERLIPIRKKISPAIELPPLEGLRGVTEALGVVILMWMEGARWRI